MMFSRVPDTAYSTVVNLLLLGAHEGLLAVSSNDKDPINKFVDLFNMNQLLPLLNDGAMDPKIPKMPNASHGQNLGRLLNKEDVDEVLYGKINIFI
ncbi:hypothetical protein LXL04_018449 [Taraxacum kok-saghyz]